MSHFIVVCFKGSSPSSAPELMSSRSTRPPNATGCRPANTPSPCPSFTMPAAASTASSAWAGLRWEAQAMIWTSSWISETGQQQVSVESFKCYSRLSSQGATEHTHIVIWYHFQVKASFKRRNVNKVANKSFFKPHFLNVFASIDWFWSQHKTQWGCMKNHIKLFFLSQLLLQ